MGCGSSGNVVATEESNGHLKSKTETNGRANGRHEEHDDLPTVVLPDTPIKPKPPVAFEIPLEEFDSSRRMSTTPPPHLHRLLQPPQPEITLPDIEEKLAEAEQRRLMLLQQRAASAQKRTQKMMKFNEMDRVDSEHSEHMEQSMDTSVHSNLNKHAMNAMNAMHIPPEPGVCEDKNI